MRGKHGNTTSEAVCTDNPGTLLPHFFGYRAHFANAIICL